MRLTLYTFLAVLLFTTANAQNYDVSGTIIEKSTGDPIPGANIIVKNTNKGEISDFDGLFIIKGVPKGATLQFSYVGFVTQEIVINSSTNLDIQLEEDVASLDEVVVIGYGTQRKELVSGAYTNLEAEKIVENNPARIEEALQGSVSGVQVNANSGSPGAALNIRIRGITTNGDNSPLVIVDGVNIGTDLSIIDPNDIETLTVVKDASSAIYGVQAANGVILITTKTGKKGRATKFSYNTYYSTQEAANKIDLMNASEYAVYVNEAEIADGNALPYPNIQNFGTGTDWQDELFTTAPIISHSLSATGGSDTVSYGFSGSYFGQEGIIAPDKSNFNRWTLKNNLGIDLSEKLQLNTFLLYTNIKRKTIPEGGRGSALYYGLNASPLTSVFDGTDGSGPSNGYSYIGTEQGNEIINPLALINNTFNETKVNRFTGKLELVYDVAENLKATTRYNFNYANVGSRTYNPLAYYGFGKVVNNVALEDGLIDLDRNDNDVRDTYSTVSENIETYFDYTWESFLDYKKSFGDHNFNGLIGTSIRSEQYDGTYTSGNLVNGPDTWSNAYVSNAQSINDEFIEIGEDDEGNPIIEDESIRTNINAATGRSEARWFSLFGRIQYDYQGRFLLSAQIRRDASTKFGPGNQVGYFPAVSAGWVVTNEDFFNSDFINKLKLRGSWGITGNDKSLGAYSWVSKLQGLNGDATYPFNDILTFGNAVGQLGNPDLQWETNHQTNIGFDLGLLNNKFDISFDYYIKKTENLLLVPEVSGVLGSVAPGSSAPFVNAGSIENKGIDLSINFNHNFSDDFGINVGYNLTSIKNKALEVNNTAGFISGGLFGLDQTTSRFETGLPIGTFYGLQTDGIFQNQAEIDAHATQTGAQPGDIRYVDVDGDGVVEFGSSDDQKVIGNPIPDVTMGLNLGLDYKQFDISGSLFASIGNDAARSYERFLTYSNKSTLYLDRWTGEGTSNTVPRASTNASNNYLFSDFFVEDASYLRIQNVQLGYSLPETVLEKIKLDKLRIYASVNNLYTFTKYRGYNPDISNANPTSAGVDLGQYPQTRTYTLGLNVSF